MTASLGARMAGPTLPLHVIRLKFAGRLKLDNLRSHISQALIKVVSLINTDASGVNFGRPAGGVVYMAASFGSTNIDMLPKVMIFFNGEEYYSEYGLIDCDYNFIDFLLYLDGKTSSNLTVVIGDPLLTQSDASWSFEFNGLMIGQSTATSTSQGFPESTNTGASVGGSSATTSISQSFGFTVAVAVVMLAFYF
ncbi:hypothetical protein D9757_000472 [Collybiopsis confluens]|uniref:Uncharacterized protein n=1 Tax=Collybiopsis confluens TaxID=2823264 RepID=A0A8H5I287_9AGAR|nr:hypothetical protein D9757_000472 [Collybiopsis confluens]